MVKWILNVTVNPLGSLVERKVQVLYRLTVLGPITKPLKCFCFLICEIHINLYSLEE